MTVNKVLSYLLGPVGAGLLGVISLPLITWFFSIEAVGKISMLQVAASFTVLLCSLGLDQSFVREFHETDNQPELFKTAFIPPVLFCVLILLAVVLIDETAISKLLYSDSSISLTFVSVICFFSALCSRFLSLILRMQERAIAYSMGQLLPKLGFLLFVLTIVWFGFSRHFSNLILANTLSVIIVLLVFVWNTRVFLFSCLRESVDFKKLQQLIRYGLPLIVGGLAAWGLNVMDKVLLRSLSNFTELGLYSVTMSIANVAILFSSVFNLIWAPLVFKWVGENKVDFKKIDAVSEHVLAAVFFIICLSGLLSWVLPFLLPTDYSAIQYLISVCLVGPLFYMLSETTAVGISISRKTSLSMFASIFAMLVNATGNFLLIPQFGAGGAAVSTAIAFFILYLVRTEFSKIVWRKMPYLKSYIIAVLLLSCAIVNAIYLKANSVAILMWTALFVAGFFVFKNSISLLCKYLVRRFA